jgi:archaellum component FlaC
MRNRILPAFACAFALAAAGCGGGKIDSHDEAFDALMDNIGERTEIIKTVKDKRSAEAAKPKLEALNKRMKDIESQAEKLGDPPADAQAKYMQRMMEATGKLMQAMQGLPDDPEVQRIIMDSAGGMDMR